MLIFIDLDGTLIDSTHPSWRPWRDGEQEVDTNRVPIYYGAIDFLNHIRHNGHKIILVSDSHPRYVNKFKTLFQLDGISLADKPNIRKLNEYLGQNPELSALLQDKSQCFFIGDTKLDVETGRRLGIRTILMKQYLVKEEDIDIRDGVGDEQGNKKSGPTYVAKNFHEATQIIDNPDNHLYCLEAAFRGIQNGKSIKFSDLNYRDGSHGVIRCLARQEQGECDPYARADKYYQIANPNRSDDFLSTLSAGISSYLNVLLQTPGYRWDYITYLTDKSTTQPPNKMKDIFDRINTSVPKARLFCWQEVGQGSLRERVNYSERQEFLKNYLTISNEIDLKGKNIIVIDDQLTTGATAFYAIKTLRARGAFNVLFIALFQMIMPVASGMACPRCGKEMVIKIRRTDGHKFYSCTPAKYGGEGCGCTVDIV